MKIAYIVEPRTVIGGGVRAAINLAKAMQQDYGEQTAIFGVHKDSIKNQDVSFIEVNTLNPISWNYVKALRKFLQEYQPEIVHCLGLYSALLLVLVKKITRANYRIICTVHRVTMNMRFRAVIKWVLPYISRNLSYTTFLTNYQKQHYFNKIGFKPQKHTIIPNVIYVERYTPEEISIKRRELQKKVGTELITCYVGRIIPSKNIEDTLRLVGILNRREIPLGCILVGGYETSYYNRLQSIITEENIQKRVHFEGYVNNPTLYIAACTTTTTTTHGEALPNLMVETFASGNVIFSSDIPQMTDLIDNGKNGFTCSLSNLHTMADIMEKVYSDAALRLKIGQAALDTYKSQYNPEIVASKYHQIYEAC